MIFQYDATEEKCPLPLVKLRVMLKKMQSGDECHLTIKDSGSKSDIPKLLDKLNYHYTKTTEDYGIQRLIITVR